MDLAENKTTLLSVERTRLLILGMRVEAVRLLLVVLVSHLDIGGSVGGGIARFDLAGIVAWGRPQYHLLRNRASRCLLNDGFDLRMIERCWMHACRQ